MTPREFGTSLVEEAALLVKVREGAPSMRLVEGWRAIEGATPEDDGLLLVSEQLRAGIQDTLSERYPNTRTDVGWSAMKLFTEVVERSGCNHAKSIDILTAHRRRARAN